jgi:hypothetical protein
VYDNVCVCIGLRRADTVEQCLFSLSLRLHERQVGWAYDNLGPCWLWATMATFWLIQFVPLLCCWSDWHPAAIETRRKQIGAELHAAAS